MKTFLFLLCFIPFIAQADVIAFTSEDEQGLMFDLMGGDNFIYKAEAAFSDELGGFGLGAGWRFGDLSLMAGVSEVDGFTTTRSIDVDGVSIKDSSEGDGESAWVELRYKYLWLRYNDYDLDYTHSARRLDVNDNLLFAEEKSSVSDDIWWVGLRFEF